MKIIPRTSRFLISITLLLGLFCGCNQPRDFNGQVFIVTDGGESIKLGLLNIHVITQADIKKLARSVIADHLKDQLNQATSEAQQRKDDETCREYEVELDRLMSSGLPGLGVETIKKDLLERKFRTSPTPGLVVNPAPLFPIDLTERLFKQLPPPETKTDADGVFKVRAMPSSWVIVRAKRRMGPDISTYLWVVPIGTTVHQGRLLISSDLNIVNPSTLLTTLGNMNGETVTPLPLEPVAVSSELATWILKSKEKTKNSLATTKVKMESDETQFLSVLGIQENTKAGESKSIGVEGSSSIPVRWIPKGRFQMGSPELEAGRFNTETLHETILTRGFFMSEIECTQTQWEKLMGNNPSNAINPLKPVDQITWDEARLFCRKLTELHNTSGIIPAGWKWELPTEAQWEYACRAGSTGSQAGDLETMAWYRNNSGNESHPVKTKQANAWGLYDMHGNVWEMVLDWYAEYPTHSVTDPTGAPTGPNYIVRGGGWGDEAKICRSALRSGAPRNFRDGSLGFRPCLSAFWQSVQD